MRPRRLSKSAKRPARRLVVMITAIDSWSKRLSLGLLCLLLTGHAGAQMTANQSGAQTLVSTANPPVVPPTVETPNKPHDDSFIIGNDDVLSISVWKEPDLSRSIPVRSDGRISLPLLGDVQAAGLTPLKLEEDIANKLQPYIASPEVAVMVQQINSQKFNILGKVVKPGSYPLTNSATVLDAIALAGGCRDFAKQGSIYILRQNPNGGESRLPFNYKDVIKGKNTTQNVRLQPHDTIVVP
jgi:polysaccharide biosynthesis/export protein